MCVYMYIYICVYIYIYISVCVNTQHSTFHATKDGADNIFTREALEEIRDFEWLVKNTTGYEESDTTNIETNNKTHEDK